MALPPQRLRDRLVSSDINVATGRGDVPRPPRPRASNRPPATAEATGKLPSAALVSRAAIVIAFVLCGAWVLRLAAPLPIRGAGLFVAAVLAAVLFRVDWNRYWRSRPRKLREAGKTLGPLILLGCVVIPASAIMWWYGTTQNNGAIALLGLGAGLSSAVVMAGFLGMEILAVLFGQGEQQSPGPDKVRKQNADIDARLAADEEIDQALKGSAKATDEKPGYKYQD